MRLFSSTVVCWWERKQEPSTAFESFFFCFFKVIVFTTTGGRPCNRLSFQRNKGDVTKSGNQPIRKGKQRNLCRSWRWPSALQRIYSTNMWHKVCGQQQIVQQFGSQWRCYNDSQSIFFSLVFFEKVITHNCKQSLDVCIQGVICWDLLLLKRAASEDDVLTNLPLNEKPYLISIWPISLSVSTLWIALDHVQCGCKF